MPLPWKKSKCKRISKFVADHLHSPPKRGGSLVVETGFPTSLVDLFVKNRNRMKKPSKKKRFEPVPDPVPVPISIPVPLDAAPWNSRLALPTGPVLAEQSGVVANGGGEVMDVNGSSMVSFKMVLVVILALGASKFVIGFTVSAFLLVFLEYVAKHLYRVLKPCDDAQKSLKSLVHTVFCFVGVKVDKFVIKEDRSLTVDSSGLIEDRSVDDPIHEIQIHRSSSISVPSSGEIQSMEYEFDFHSEVSEEMRKQDAMEKEEVCVSDVVDLKSRKTDGAKIKSKIEKLLPKKLLGSKRKRLESKTEAAPPGGDNKLVMRTEQESLEEEGQGGLEHVEKSTSSTERNGDHIDVADGICSSSEVSRPAGEDSIVREDIGIKTERKLGHIVLILLVLTGLVGGRVLALALTLSWCLLWRLTGTLSKFTKGYTEEVSISSRNLGSICL
ncbi:uncharacterized protein LOC127795750 [Diospyros lotus]|uniref:uncharacterized protein LOC127795750 n=1 Tax=Diospyros lotus TaxID=55363 RepID=UPI00224DA63C|nr:uncharacterized protein LOC127795750 [Diospyros lotus]